MSEKDIRWEQRFSSYNKALNKLGKAVEYIDNDLHKDEQDPGNSAYNETLDDIIKAGLIKSFEFTYELAWKVMKDYIFYQGNPDISGSKDAIREAFSLDLINDGHVWMEMINYRNLTSHTYNKETANEIYLKIINEYYPAFLQFQVKMEEKRSGEQQELFKE